MRKLNFKAGEEVYVRWGDGLKAVKVVIRQVLLESDGYPDDQLLVQRLSSIDPGVDHSAKLFVVFPKFVTRDPEIPTQAEVPRRTSKWLSDVREMHKKFGAHSVVDTMSPDILYSLACFRKDFIHEESAELELALEEGDADGYVDALIDLIVVAAGTLDLFDVDADAAWNRVLEANMSKVAGTNPTRPNHFGFPDMIKPEGWVAPSHKGIRGMLDEAMTARPKTRREYE